MSAITPMMQQWHDCKREAAGQLLLFRMGDFYEAFYEDAEELASILELTLTQRGGIPMAGIPWHAADGYLEKLMAADKKVAIAEQLEDPKQAKGLVKRAIVRVVTPGTWLSKEEEKSHQYIVTLNQVGSLYGLALLDMTTGVFQAGDLENLSQLEGELYRLSPKEIVTTKNFINKHPELIHRLSGVTTHSFYPFEHEFASRTLTDHFKVMHLDGFGLKGKVAAINAAGALLSYVHDTLKQSIDHILSLSPYLISDAMAMDRTTLRNLELSESVEKNGPTLLKTLDVTLTAMGGRKLREWIKRPLIHLTPIRARHDGVELLVHSDLTRTRIRAELNRIRDLERLIMKLSSGLASPKDLKALSDSLRAIAPLRDLLTGFSAPILEAGVAQLADFSELISELDRAIVAEPPVRLGESRFLQEGYHQEFDELLQLTKDSKGWLANYQTRIKEESGIKNLKVTYNRVFGYSIEISKGQAHLAPPTFERRQTLANAERFVSEELKVYEHKVVTAEEQMVRLEKEIFASLCATVLKQQALILTAAGAIATLDALQSLAEVARKYDYVKPTLDDSDRLEIIEGRHPVIEKRLEQGQFIPNDTLLGENRGRMMMLTGPNMAGKSTYIRQVALIVVMAQMGGFVPARSVKLGVVDKLFTRIGASDDLARGQSTFMVEMSETANILRNATSRSLVILDEIGRGTSTYDGVSIAWAVAEYLLMTEHRQAKTLFATHYWELTELAKHFPDVINAHAAVDEREGQITFSHKIKPGAADRSYGIHVAQLAGLPPAVIKRATEILKKLEAKKGKGHEPKSTDQLLLF